MSELNMRRYCQGNAECLSIIYVAVVKVMLSV